MLLMRIILKPFPPPPHGKTIFHETGPWHQKGWGPLLQKTVLLGLCLYLVSYLLFSHLTGPRTRSNIRAQLSAEMDPTAEAYVLFTLIMGWCPLPLGPPKSLPAQVQTGKFSLTSGVVILSLHFSRAQLPPLALFFECLGENKSSVLLHLTNTSCPAQGPIYLTPHDHRQSGSEVCGLSPGVTRLGRREGGLEE